MEDIEYKIRKSKRAKNIRLSITSDASVTLTLPWWVPVSVGKLFVQKKKAWIVSKLRIKKEELRNRVILTRSDYLKNKDRARVLVADRLKYFNRFYNFSYNRISIRDTKSRWGSCSGKNNLNFSYKIIFLPSVLADYLIVHELCHLGEMNHSIRFWNLVSRVIPDYKAIRRELRLKTL